MRYSAFGDGGRDLFYDVGVCGKGPRKARLVSRKRSKAQDTESLCMNYEVKRNERERERLTSLTGRRRRQSVTFAFPAAIASFFFFWWVPLSPLRVDANCCLSDHY